MTFLAMVDSTNFCSSHRMHSGLLVFDNCHWVKHGLSVDPGANVKDWDTVLSLRGGQR